MSTARHIIALLKSYAAGEEQQFHSVALQMAAHEARLGHNKLALEIKELVDKSKMRRSSIERKQNIVSIVQPKGELASLLSVEHPDTRLKDMILPEMLEEQIKRILLEQNQRSRLQSYNLSPRRKILLVGLPGTGKTMTASTLAGELNLPLFTAIYSSLIGKYMGETAGRLKLIFNAMKITRGVYFFDEFDAIGTQRNNTNDVGEIRRILNSFLLLLDNDQSESIIIAATNHPNLLDKALFRRFDDVIEYALPNKVLIRQLIETRLVQFKPNFNEWTKIIDVAKGLSPAEIIRAADEAAKSAVLSKSKEICAKTLCLAILERQKVNSQRLIED